MSESTSQKFNAREVELAKKMKANEDIEWEVKTGDWFLVEGAHHTVFQVEGEGDQVVLVGQRGERYEKSDVVPLMHRVDCREWLMENDYDFNTENMDDGTVKVTARKRGTEFSVTHQEPTELAAIYAVMIDIGELRHMGGWG